MRTYDPGVRPTDRANQNSFDPTEHRGIGSYTECEAKNCQDGKAGTAPKYSEAEAKVLQKGLHLPLHLKIHCSFGAHS
jgi:hypothetical protein